jgi:transcriptional regulator with XRE-family HTH domain
VKSKHREESFGEMLRRFRVSKRLTYRMLGDALGLSIAYLHDVEHSRRGPLSKPEIASMAVAMPLTPAQQRALEHAALVEVQDRARRKWERGANPGEPAKEER